MANLSDLTNAYNLAIQQCAGGYSSADEVKEGISQAIAALEKLPCIVKRLEAIRTIEQAERDIERAKKILSGEL